MEFLAGVPGAVWANLGWSAVALAAVIAILRGLLVPKVSVDALLALHQKALDQTHALHKERLEQAERRGDEWKSVAEKASARADSFSSQNETMLGAITETTKLLGAMRRVAEERT